MIELCSQLVKKILSLLLVNGDAGRLPLLEGWEENEIAFYSICPMEGREENVILNIKKSVCTHFLRTIILGTDNFKFICYASLRVHRFLMRFKCIVHTQ